MFFRRINAWGKNHPWKFGVGVASVKTGGVDYFTQRVLEKKRNEDVNWNRVAVFTSFGAVYLGGVQYFLYNQVWPWFFPSTRAFAELPLRAKLCDWNGMLTGLKQLALDHLWHNPFLYYPSFYALQSIMAEFLENPNKDGDALSRMGSALATAQQRWRTNFVEDQIAVCKVWVVPQLINFWLLPFYMRVPWVAFVSLLWMVILSFTRGDPSKDAKKEALKGHVEAES